MITAVPSTGRAEKPLRASPLGRRRKHPGHIDFLYPARSLWRKTLTTCKLSVVEDGEARVERVDDLPGAEAPARYMEFLSSSSVAVIEPVFIHNERDIVSLAALSWSFHERLATEPACDRLGLVPRKCCGKRSGSTVLADVRRRRTCCRDCSPARAD